MDQGDIALIQRGVIHIFIRPAPAFFQFSAVSAIRAFESFGPSWRVAAYAAYGTEN